MATIAYTQPDIYIPEGVKAPPVRELPAAAGHTGTSVINRADLVVVSSNPAVLARAATNTATGIAGYAIAGELDVFKGGSSPYDAQLFGYAQGSAILPQNPGYLTINQLGVGPAGGLLLQMNVTNITGYQTGGSQQCDVGTTGGLLLDSTTNLFVFDQTQSNKILTIYEKVLGVPSVVGQSGDTGARFYVYINVATALS